jgi:hypothetical protein
MSEGKLDRDRLDHMFSCGFCEYGKTSSYSEPCKTCITQGYSSYNPTHVPAYAKKEKKTEGN